jgi:hypothetical protein
MVRLLPFVLVAGLVPAIAAADPPFEDETWRRCVTWMLEGTRGGLLENQCVNYFNLPPPSLFRCARKVRDGYDDANDRAVCVIILEGWVKKAREGYIK